MRKLLYCLMVIQVCLVANAWGQIVVQPKISTLGIGGEVIFNVRPSLNARVGGNFMDLDMDREFEDIEYDVGIDFMSYTALLDWHLFNNSFRITGGAVFNDNEATLKATPSGNVEIGGQTYDAVQYVGSLSANFSYVDDVAPYIGIGFGNPINAKSRIGLSMDIGVMYAGKPDLTLTASGGTGGTVDPADLAQEEKDIEDTEYLKWYPVIGLNLFIRF